jgi:signal transduction histidine kinase/CheY-like chemotaxis protein
MSEAGVKSNNCNFQREIEFALFGELALKSEDLEEILTEACRLAAHVLGTGLAKVVQLKEDGHTMLVRAGIGWGPNVVGVAKISAAEDTSEGHCLRTGEPMISPDISKETRFKYPQFLIDNGVQAVANVIIIGGYGKPPFGVLQIDSRVPRTFTEADTLFLRSYANLIAAAVDRIRVANETREHEARLREELQETVARRTTELTEANAKLQKEAEDRVRVEEALRQSTKMEAVGQLTGGLAHDFNNLLAVISGSLKLIGKRVRQGRISEIYRYIDAATISVERAASVTHRLLSFSRRQTLDPKPIAMNDLIEGMWEILLNTVGPGIVIERGLATALWETICDPHQLENALLNIVINARDAMPNGGHIQIMTSNSIMSGPDTDDLSIRVPKGEYVELLITDTGSGMTPAVIERAFDPFFTTKHVGQGTGLGLSMIYGFVKQSGGHISLNSAEGRGTTVAIYLPRHINYNDDIEANGAPVCSAETKSSLVILLVEDEPFIRLLMADILSEDGYTVIEADNGKAAMRHIFSSARIDLLLTDIGLPDGMNGRQLAEAARQHRAHLKVLFVTGYDEDAAQQSGPMEQGIAILTKPFDPDAFSAKVSEIIKGARSDAFEHRSD